MFIFWESTRKARKEHFCDYCCHGIYPGDTYHRHAWAIEPGKFLIMNRHSYPSQCHEEEHVESPEEEVPVRLTYAVRLEAVHRVLLGGEVETRFEPRLVAVASAEPELCIKYDDDPNDIPF